MTDAAGTTITKWVSVAGFVGVGFYRLIVLGDLTNGLSLISLGAWMGGATKSIEALHVRANCLEEKQESIKDDLSIIKASPNLPGTPLGDTPPA